MLILHEFHVSKMSFILQVTGVIGIFYWHFMEY
jgi:hypothetical protein